MARPTAPRRRTRAEKEAQQRRADAARVVSVDRPAPAKVSRATDQRAADRRASDRQAGDRQAGDRQAADQRSAGSRATVHRSSRLRTPARGTDAVTPTRGDRTPSGPAPFGRGNQYGRPDLRGRANQYGRVVSLATFRAMAGRTRWRPSRRTVIIAVVSLMVAVLLGYVFWFSPLLAVRKVQLIGGDRFGSPQLQALAGPQVGVPLARVGLAELEDRIASDPAVKSARVVRVWPSTLEVRVTERIPVVAVPVLEGAASGPSPDPDGQAGDDPEAKAGVVELMAVDGVVIETVAEAPQGLPPVTAETVQAGQDAVLASAQVVNALPEELRAQVSQVSATSRDSVMMTMEVPVVSTGAETSGDEATSEDDRSEGEQAPSTRSVTVVWGAVDDSALKAEVLEVLLQSDAKVYDVSSPSTPVTRDSALPVPSPSSPAAEPQPEEQTSQPEEQTSQPAQD